MVSRATYPVAAVVGPAVGMVVPLLTYVYLKQHPVQDLRLAEPAGHFYIVSLVAILAAAIAVAVGIAGMRQRNIEVIFLSLAFTSLALIFALHGLATPGFLLPGTRVPGVAAQLSTLLTAFWLWMSSHPSDHPWVAALARRQRLLVPAWTGLLVVAVLLGLWFPELVAWVPVDQSPPKWVLSAVTVLMLLVSAYRYLQSYRYARFPLQLATVYSAGWLAVAQVIMVTGQVWLLSWWIYHLLLLAATVLMVAGLVQQYSAGASVGTAVRGMFSTDVAERIEAGLSQGVRALVVATETRDRYTAGHSFRVAMAALRLAEAMRLPPEQLRTLAQGAVVHDVGKIEVPDHILNKPGSLTAEERAIIRRHPVTGYEMCKRLGFMKEELEVIRSHHERWDGAGYPDGLKGEQIPLLARLLAVADVYDALTSARSYRDPWSHEEARRLLREGAGSQFDPVCVAAWLSLTVDRPLVERYPSWALAQPASGSVFTGGGKAT